MVSQAKHSRAKEVFLEAVDLPAEDRDSYLDQACNRDSALREEVESLLAHHSPDSIFGESPAETPAGENAHTASGARGASGTSRLDRLAAGRMARLLWTLAAVATLVAVGYFTHSRIERALLDIRADELTTMLDAQIHALDLWIEDQKAQLGFLTGDPRVVRYTKELLADGDRAEDKVEAWLGSSAREGLLAVADDYMKNTGIVGVEVLDERGVIVHATNDHDMGLVLEEDLLDELSVVFRGRTIFVRPYRFEDIVVMGGGGTMYSFALGPLRDSDGRIIAAVASVQRGYGPGSISSILEVSQLGETGETYAFDRDGTMLSESRFTEELRRTGLAPSVVERGREWEAGAQLNVQVRDPGGDLARGHVPELEVGARPLTRLAALAAAAREESDPDELRGIILEPYRNYRGAEVIGGWQWLPEHDFAVATEIEAHEALAPLHYLRVLFGVLFVLLSVFATTTLVSAFSLIGLRRRVRVLTELGPYQLASPIGEGGMGVVYLAEHALLKRRTAVKILSGELSKESIARFEREVSLASRLTHPNTIEIYDYGRSPEGVFYYAMEYVEGPTLTELVTRFGLPPEARVIHILKQVCASLGEAHREGLIHRDIKPQNIMLCVRGGDYDVVKVLDFGLVKEVTKSSSEDLSRGIHLGGTPLYMAPERVTSPKALDARVDIYSLGCVAYYLLTGRPLFESKGDLDLLDKIVNAAPRPLHEVCQQAVTEELEKLVADCLSKDPRDRPATVFAIMDRLESLSGVGRWTQEEATHWWKQEYPGSRSG